ncbi:hypothetical protein BN434_1935 [Erwinia amylovora CFBP 2585]|uniref:Uncharacterized protein n=1 Tax=Erwinia amylovora ATCC BAA-2158 TaxID=889211 RepID=E5B5K5_ERWAM|nr:hypothetical protein predicted by Glimmer/Critica [Erwinia amylovora ATCC BAA-2158]CCO82538.1 hypothetical protein BN433_1968 [Erwinia amylovora Ea266]CCO86323.1 hypothetical protein BN434_1935 [Erwinia amylovora CFBP 2585]
MRRCSMVIPFHIGGRRAQTSARRPEWQKYPDASRRSKEIIIGTIK